MQAFIDPLNIVEPGMCVLAVKAICILAVWGLRWGGDADPVANQHYSCEFSDHVSSSVRRQQQVAADSRQ